MHGSGHPIEGELTGPKGPGEGAAPGPAAGPGQTTRTDDQLLVATRGGDPHAFAELWLRYEADARSFARSLVPTGDVDDVVNEAFAKVLNAIRRGGGPSSHPVRYIMVTVRSVAYAAGSARVRNRRLQRRLRNERQVLPGTPALPDDHLTLAFGALPKRWREVLWWTEVEGLSCNEVGERIGVSPAGAASLAYRARKALRAEYARQASDPAEAG
ncbi:MAG: sigma-70 region 2 domain protein [Acidimicrobiales bacterium]|nr:sigma-70 region 2 domain protein [Acidimicrobiales bacterium]